MLLECLQNDKIIWNTKNLHAFVQDLSVVHFTNYYIHFFFRSLYWTERTEIYHRIESKKKEPTIFIYLEFSAHGAINARK